MACGMTRPKYNVPDPDMGSGRYSSKPNDEDWEAFNRKILELSLIPVCQELQQTKSVAARNQTSDLPDSGRPDEPKGYNVKLFS
ncbi:hypothetical protein BB560_001995 [Smittium megazygosporum]|uniref:Uncharacterized protein n=1 Tax=Smittium megazygosporum TaxID=133381 RepID=A0A2T9ZG40_9FUNG|nr:hypothetical protein BB560_001995 [Smittium megazygosporum]